MAAEGLEDINKAFDNLERGAQIRVLRSSLRAALTPVVKALKASAPTGNKPHKTYKGRTVAPGFLRRRGVIKSVRVSKDKKRVLGNVRLASEAWYGSLIEHGWRAGKRSKKIKRASRKKGSLSTKDLKSLGDRRRKIPGTKWFSKTINRLDDQVLDAYSEKMERAIIKEWLK